MGRFNDELIRAGVLLAAEGLDDAAEGVVVDYSSEPPVVTDGPYGETKELFGGFYILNVASKEEAVEWAKRIADAPGRASRPRSAGSRRSTSSRRTTSGSRRSGRGARPPASSESGSEHGRPHGREAVAAVWRIESARIVGALARYTGDFALAEDLAQEALAEALVTWPRDGRAGQPGGRGCSPSGGAGRSTRSAAAPPSTSGTPPSPATWARAARSRRAPTDPAGGRRRAVGPGPDRRRRARADVHLVPPGAVAGGAGGADAAGGRRSDERRDRPAFLVPTATVQARITRAKKTLAAARVPFEVPPAAERAERLGSVLSVIYLIFTEGSSATSGDELIRLDLAGEAQRLARVLARLVPDEPEVHGLLALLELTAARFPARTGPDGEPVLLEHQDRRRWDRAAIRRGRAALAQRRAGRPGPRRLRPAGRDRRVPRGRAVGRRDRLGARRAPLRGARPARAVAGGRPQPGGRGLHGPGPGGGAADRRRARGRRRARRTRTCCRASAASCSPAWDAPTRRAPSWSAPSSCAATSASGRCCERKLADLG